MRLKTINVNGRRIGAADGMVYIVKNVVSNYAELSFSDMDAIQKALEEGKSTTLTSIRTRSTGYNPEIHPSEGCGATVEANIQRGLVVAFGCYEVGNLEEFKKAYEQLKEINKDPEWKPAPGLVATASGYLLKVVEGIIHTTDEDGNLLDTIGSLEDANVALKNMEYRATLTMPESPKNFRVTGIGADVQLQYACQIMKTDEVKRLLEVLNQAGATTKTEPVAG